VRTPRAQPKPTHLRPNADLAVALLEATQTIVCVHDRDGRFVYFNRACEETTGFTSEEAVGRDARELVIAPEEEAGFSLLLHEIWSDQRPRPGKGEWLTRDGGRRKILFMNQPLVGEDGEVRYLVSTGLDITEQERDAELLRRLHDEQAALRRVATFVASGAEPEEVARLVTLEAGRLIGADAAGLARYNHADQTAYLFGTWTDVDPPGFPTGTLVPLDGDTPTATVYRTGRPARIDDYRGLKGEIAESARRFGYRSTVAAPVTVGGDLWGALIVTSRGVERLPPDTEARLAGFVELVALALASSDAREQLAASRARLVEAGDAARRRIERDLHDGAQQRLVSLALAFRTLQTQLARDPEKAATTLEQMSVDLREALEELRELARGIHPAVLTERGLAVGLEALADRSTLPVAIGEVPGERLPAAIEVAVYFLVSEALTNAAKHAGASSVIVSVRQDERALWAEVADDGRGGADAEGSGLRGLADRVEALGGRLDVVSPPGDGTVIRARLPLSTTA
jgi:PAS domain S-box-containing protein